MKILANSFTKLTVLSVILLAAFTVNYLRAFNGPPATAPYCPTGSLGCDAPINASDSDQEKVGGIKLESLWATTSIQADGGYYFGPQQRLFGDHNSALYWESAHDTVTQMLFRDLQGTLYGKVYGGGDGSYFGLLDGDGNWSYFAEKDTKTEFRVNDDTKMTILSDGKVGIGTKAPQEKLHVEGDLELKNSNPSIKFNDTDSGQRNWQLVNGSNNIFFKTDRDANGTFDDGPHPLVISNGDNQSSANDDYASFANDVNIGGELGMKFEEKLFLSDFDRTAGNNNAIWADNNSGYNVNVATRGKFVIVGDSNAQNAVAKFVFGKRNSGKPGYDYQNNFTELFTVDDNGLARSSGGWGSLSDARLKTNVAPITDSLQKVEALNGVTFDWKNTENHTQVHDLGLIAQEVQEVLPEVVYQGDENMDGMLTVDYGRITAVLIEAVKELSAENDELEARIAELEIQRE